MNALFPLCIVATQLPLAAQLTSAAQTPAFVQPSAPVQPSTPRTLAEALETISWSPAERGVLLVVGAENTRATMPLPPAPQRGYNLKDLVSYFDRMMLPVGSLTIIAPTTMRLLVKPTQSPEDASWQNPDEAFRALLASLSKSQWQTLASENGLGLSDLAQKQRAMFLAGLPDIVQLRPVPAQVTEKTEQGITRIRREPLPEAMSTILLTPEQRSSVRIRVNRKLTFTYAPEGSDSGGFSMGGRTRMGRTEAHYALFPDFSPRETETGIQDLPNRTKPSDLNVAGLRGSLTLTGATTLGELVKRAAQESRLEIYADPRVASLSIRAWGERATTGDVLAALCRAVTGTFRRVGPAYVLTHDREGLAALGEPLNLWQNAVAQLKAARGKEQNQALRQVNPTEFIGFAPGDPIQLPSEQIRRLEAETKAGRPVGLAVGDLPSALQQKVQEEVAQANESFASGQRNASQNGKPVTAFRSDKVWPRFELNASLILPRYGAFPWEGGGAFFIARNALFERSVEAPSATTNKPLPMITWPQGERIVLVGVQTPEEAKALAKAARAGGLNTLWLKVPLSAKRTKPLLAAAQAEGIAVGLAVSPFDALVDALPTGATPDLTATGVTSDVYAQRWLPFQDQVMSGQTYRTDERLIRGDDAALLALVELARLPKLAGLYLAELIPAGYQKPPTGMFMFPVPRMGDFGYTVENRLAFLRQTGCDPIDSVIPGNYSSNTVPPFFSPFGMMPNFVRQPDGKMVMQPPIPNVYDQWQAFREAQGAAFVPRLQARLSQAAPALPLYTMGKDPIPWVGTWDRPEPPSALGMPKSGSFDSSNATLLPKARVVSKRVFSLLPSFPQLTPTILREGVNYLSKGFPGWDGAVLSLLDIPYQQVLALLNGLSEGSK